MSEYTPVDVNSAISHAEAIWLYEQAKLIDSVVELGSWTGKSTHALLSGCKGTVYAVDHFQGSKEKRDATHGKSGKSEFIKTTKGFSNLILMEIDTVKAAEVFKDKSVDMLFIDAGHTYEEFLTDCTAWFPKIKKLICGHDIHYASIIRVLTELKVNWKPVENGTLWRLI